MHMFASHNLAVTCATFLAFTAATWATMVFFFRGRSHKVEDRLRSLIQHLGHSENQPGLLKDETFSLEGRLKDGMRTRSIFLGRAIRFAFYFEQADLPFSLVTFFGACMGAAAAGVLTAWAINLSINTYPLMMFVGVAPLFFYVHSRRLRRLRELSEQLPDALGMLARGLRAGNGLAAGFRTIADEMRPPISVEFQRVSDAHQLGISVDEALNKMLERVPDRDLKFFCTAIALQRRSGGNLAEILDKISHIVQERFTILGHVKALTGEGRLSGVVLTALPFVMFAALYFLNAEYVMVLFTDPIGQRMLAGAAVLQVLGAISIRQIVRIEI